MLDFVQGIGLDVLATLAAALLATTFLDDAIASALSRVPVFGAPLASVARRLSARFRDWLLERVPRTAEAKVAEVESRISAAGAGKVKAQVAAAELVKAEPGLTQTEAEKEIQAAYDRLLGTAKLAEHRTTPPVGGTVAK